MGLKNGKHAFEFELDKTFFDSFEYSPVKAGNFQVKLDFNKQETMIIVGFNLLGHVELQCDRCGEEYLHPMQIDEKLIFKMGDSAEMESTDEIVILSKSDHEINFGPFFYEFIVVNQPLAHIHPDDAEGNPQCDPETLKALEKLKINEEQSNPDVVIDPRWEALKKLRDN